MKPERHSCLFTILQIPILPIIRLYYIGFCCTERRARFQLDHTINEIKRELKEIRRLKSSKQLSI